MLEAATEIGVGCQGMWRARSGLFSLTTRSISPRKALRFFTAGPVVVPPGHGCFSQVGFDEGNAEQYVCYMSQNMAGLVTALGGRDAVAKRLDKFTSQLNCWSGRPISMGR